MSDVTKIVSDIEGGNIKPIYFLMGDEPYYIDKISEVWPTITSLDLKNPAVLIENDLPDNY